LIERGDEEEKKIKGIMIEKIRCGKNSWKYQEILILHK